MTIRQNGQILAGAVTGPYKANTDMDNLTDVGKNIANWSNNVTNCITEIPQDIKLELSGTTLTLKADSKVYIPNGFEADGTTRHFNVVTIANDITKSESNNYTWMMFYKNNSVYHSNINYCFSGSSAPTGQQYMAWYDTTNNLVKRTSNSGSTWESGFSLPLCIDTSTNGVISSLDQVFNGFGYIGSTVFALPGVKGLIPNGRNEDGTLKNTEFETNSLQILTATSDIEDGGYIYSTLGQGHLNQTRDYTEVDTLPENPRQWATCYLKPENMQYRFDGTNWSKITNNIIFAITHRGTSNPYPIISLTPKTPFHAVDYNDSSTISGWSMPSSRYIDLTLGASGATYMAPANGWFYFYGKAASATASLAMVSGDYRISSAFANNSGIDPSLILPVIKADTVTIAYNSITTSSNILRFVYAEGEN